MRIHALLQAYILYMHILRDSLLLIRDLGRAACIERQRTAGLQWSDSGDLSRKLGSASNSHSTWTLCIGNDLT